MIKIISIDDHKLFFEGLNAIMEKETDFVLINGYEKINEIQEFLNLEKPDVILLDIYLQEKSGITLARAIKSKYPHIKIIMLSMEIDNNYLHEFSAIGVEAYLSKEIEAHQLIEIIKKVYNGESFDISETDFSQQSKSEVLSDSFNLTDREIEVFEYIKRGYTNQAIADVLHRSIWTIKTHRKNIKQKLSIKSGFKFPVDFNYLNNDN